MVIGVGAVFYAVTPAVGILCENRLVMHFGRPLEEGTYYMDIAADDYANHCQLIVDHQSMRKFICKSGALDYSGAGDKWVVPTSASRVKIDMRRDGQQLIGRTLTPHYSASSELTQRGCASAEVFVPFGVGSP